LKKYRIDYNWDNQKTLQAVSEYNSNRSSGSNCKVVKYEHGDDLSCKEEESMLLEEL